MYETYETDVKGTKPCLLLFGFGCVDSVSGSDRVVEVAMGQAAQAVSHFPLPRCCLSVHNTSATRPSHPLSLSLHPPALLLPGLFPNQASMASHGPSSGPVHPRHTPPPRPSSSPIHDHGRGRHTPPIAEDTLKNIDLGGSGEGPVSGAGGGSSGGGAKSRAAGAAALPAHAQQQVPRQQQQPRERRRVVGGRGHAASSTWTLVLAQIKRFDIEWCIGALTIIFVCSAVAVFTRDKGWFQATSPLQSFPVTEAVAVFQIGLSMYVSEAHGPNSALTLYTHEGPISELSPRAGHIAVLLFCGLVLSLLFSVGLLWYIALFYPYLKSSEVLPSRELAVRLFGLKALALGLFLFGLGTCAFRAVLLDDLTHHPSTSFNEVDVSRLRLGVRYAYGLTVVAWFFWLIVGSVFFCRSWFWAKQPRAVDEELVLDGMGGYGEEEDATADV